MAKSFYANVGPKNVGYWNLRRSTARGVGGRFVADPSADYIVPEAWRWPSVKRYHKQALSSQLAELAKDINAWVRHVGVSKEAVVLAALTPTFEKSKVYCPKDKGLADPLSLVNSARLTVTKKNDTVVASMSYGAKGMPFYAVFVHEIMRYRHAPPTRAKFLEAAVKEDLHNIKDRLSEGTKKITGGGR